MGETQEIWTDGQLDSKRKRSNEEDPQSLAILTDLR